MYPDSQLETDQWVAVITKNIDLIKNPKPAPQVQISNNNTNYGANNNYNKQPEPVYSKPKPEPDPVHVEEPDAPDFNPNKDGVRSGNLSFTHRSPIYPSYLVFGVYLQGLEAARDEIPYLQQGQEGTEEGRIFEFWQIWSESIPSRAELEEGSIGIPFFFHLRLYLRSLVFEVSASADLEKLSWRASGPQHIFIQKMVSQTPARNASVVNLIGRLLLECWCP